MKSFLCLTVLSQLTLFPQVAMAGPTGASACPPYMAAVGGTHTREGATTGSLTDGGFVVTVNGASLENVNSTTVSDLVFDIEVSGGTFRGILIRVDNTTSDQVTTTTATLGPAEKCGEVGSVTHSDPSDKKDAIATVTLDEPATHIVDVTVVVENEEASTYYYSSFSVVSDAAVTDKPAGGDTSSGSGSDGGGGATNGTTNDSGSGSGSGNSTNTTGGKPDGGKGSSGAASYSKAAALLIAGATWMMM